MESVHSELVAEHSLEIKGLRQAQPERLRIIRVSLNTPDTKRGVQRTPLFLTARVRFTVAGYL